MRKTKIISTIGPATWHRNALESLAMAGVDVFRLNFSHADYERFSKAAAIARELSDTCDRPIGVLGDLQGPKIRTGKLAGGKPVELLAGKRCVITSEQIEGTAQRFSTTYPNLPKDVKPGDTILLSDGKMALKVLDASGSDITCEVVRGGRLAEFQGINLPGTDISEPALTQKDISDLEFCLEHDFDFVALSFVRRPEDILTLRNQINRRGKDTPIVAKIEKPEALRCIGDIVNATDIVMVARGDLGVEMPLEQVPVEQKKLIALCNCAGKPVITATQMLESMIHNSTPTRAETSDVANAIFDGTDAVMLSAETAVGEYPVAAVEMMSKIALTVERASQGERRPGNLRARRWDRHYDLYVEQAVDARESSIEFAAAEAAVSAAETVNAKAIIVFTLSGSTAMAVSKRRPASPIYALTPTPEAYNRLSMVWGVEAVKTPLGEDTDSIIATGEQILLKTGRIRSGDAVVIVSGTLPVKGATNVVKIETVENR